MNFFFDIFGLRRRQGPRVAARWLVDVRVPDTESFVGFFTCDISILGMRMIGETSESFKHVLPEDGRSHMRLRMPGYRRLLPVEAELKWGMGEIGNFQTGWRFTQINQEVENLLNEYIETHPDDIIQDPRNVQPD